MVVVVVVVVKMLVHYLDVLWTVRCWAVADGNVGGDGVYLCVHVYV